MNAEHKAYIDKYKLKHLGYYGDEALYQTAHGAVTIARAIEMDKLRSAFLSRKQVTPVIIQVSDELAKRNERCIELYGCGEFSP